PTRPATPALMCTTVPPAKSRAPSSSSMPPGPHTMWAIGGQLNVNQSSEKNSRALKRTRSASEPTIRAVVSPAKVHWKATNTNSGSFTSSLNVSASESIVTPDRNSFESEPKYAVDSVNATEYP